MKKKVVLLLLALSVAGANARKIEGDSFKKALEGRGINVQAETTVVTPEAGSFQFITIKNDSPNVVTYDPSKITSYLEGNGEKLAKKVRLKRMAYGAGALAALAGSIGVSGYLAKWTRELTSDRPEFRQQGQRYINRGLTGQDPLDTHLGEQLKNIRSMRQRIKAGLLGSTGILLTSAMGFMPFVLLLVGYQQLSPKHIIQEKIMIDPGQKVQVLLWFKSKEKCNSSVDIDGKYKLLCTSDAYQAMNKALEVE